VHTPAFERLAAEAVLFANAFTTAPQCSPARAALFSGRCPHSVGVMGNVGKEHGWRFPVTERHAARIFSDAGYQTWLLGMLHETYLPETLGFDRIDTGFSVLEAHAHLAQCLRERDAHRPFYCQIGCRETHRPWERDGTPPDDSLGVTVPPYLQDGPLTRADMAQLQGAVRRLDTGLGRLLDLLATSGLVEDTVLIVTTDHGLAVPRAKCALYDPGIGVFLFLCWPGGGWPAGAARSDLVSHVDVLPTVLDACGIGVPENMQGRGFLPLLAGGEYEPRDAVFAEKTLFQVYDPMRAIRTERYKYIRNFEFCRQTEVGLDFIRSGSHRELDGRYDGGHVAEELYDLVEDPLEMNNLAGENAMAGVRRELAERLANWMLETGDPLVHGPVASPFYHRQVREMFGQR
jgi:arylsulfatase A-like enzyme